MSKLNIPRSNYKILKLISACLVVLAVGVMAYASIGFDSAEHTHTEASDHGSDALTESAASSKAVDSIDPTKIPIGDGKYGSTPQVGYIYSCQSNLNGPGAFKDGPWIDAADKTWSKTSKTVTVDGDVSWPSASFQINKNSQARELVGNGLPINHTTGKFPIASSDDAYLYDRNPNSIRAQNVVLSLPINPIEATKPTCLSVGAIGYTTNGVALFNALDAGGRDAAAHEIQDKCDGHPERSGAYHYHDYSACVQTSSSKEPVLVGYALDGFGIYKYPENPTNAELDECHGRKGGIVWDGVTVNMYHYVITTEYPYTLGCFKGKIN